MTTSSQFEKFHCLLFFPQKPLRIKQKKFRSLRTFPHKRLPMNFLCVPYSPTEKSTKDVYTKNIYDKKMLRTKVTFIQAFSFLYIKKSKRTQEDGLIKVFLFFDGCKKKYILKSVSRDGWVLKCISDPHRAFANFMQSLKLHAKSYITHYFTHFFLSRSNTHNFKKPHRKTAVLISTDIFHAILELIYRNDDRKWLWQDEIL